MGNLIMAGASSPFTLAGKPLLFSSGGSAPVAPPSTNPPTAGMSGWWDASALSWGSNITTLTDKSLAGKNASTSAKANPRLAGTLGGIYSEPNWPSNYTALHPYINDYSVTANSIATTAGALTVFLVWSRPNLRQPNNNGTLSTAPVALVDLNGVTVLSMTANGDGNDVLTLFPSGSPVTGGTLELRHTHALRLVFNGSTVDVWLDGSKAISGATNQATIGATVNLTYLNAAQCVFHEAAAWNHALSDADHATLTSYESRWPLGVRRAANGLLIGQSNADNFVNNVFPTMNRLVAYWTGCLSSNLLNTFNVSSGRMTFSGQGLYDSSNGLFLDGSSGASNVATWPLGGNGNSYMAALDSLSADQRANIRYVAWFWSESDSAALTYANKATYAAAMKRAISLIRTHLGVTAAQLPVLVINALPFPTAEGCQTHREVMADLVADATQNVAFMLAQSDDAIGQGDSWDAATGLESGAGNNAHRDPADFGTFAHRMAIPVARSVVAAGAARSASDVVTAIDASVPVTCGPKIVSAAYEGTAYAATGSVLVTVAHDGGNDLVVPLRAALGVGWTLMDGVSDTVKGTPGAPGALIGATACVRVSATQLRLTLAALPSHPAKAQLYYAYGTGLDANAYAVIGRGNAVTDNFSSVTLAAGWRIGADKSAADQPNNPLQATTYGVALN